MGEWLLAAEAYETAASLDVSLAKAAKAAAAKCLAQIGASWDGPADTGSGPDE